ncbi:MAG TPA: hypothetical protein VNJ53_03875, partial [Gaiellaceae bacterium]|nr:hypothetical protein [Gaiellaceae bacterium]
CGGSAGSEGSSLSAGRSIGFEELSAAADSSAQARSGRFAFDFTISGSGLEETIGLSGEGAFDADAERAHVAVDLSAFASLLGGLFAGLAGPQAPDLQDPDGWRIEAIQDGEATYVRFPALAELLPDGRSWVLARPGSAGQGFDFSQLRQFSGNDPRELLELLRAASGTIEVVGTESLRGTEVTHYRATVDPERASILPRGGEPADGALAEQLLAQSGVEAIPVDVWMDGSGLVRKLALTVTGTQPGTAESGTASMSFELWDYGEDVGIEPPPADEVVVESALRD